MFTGIVEEVGTVRQREGSRIAIAAPLVVGDAKPGDSIAVNGVCLTVERCDDAGFVASVMPETLRRTNLGQLGVGDRVNLERALMTGGRFGGHFVQGHVDGTGTVVAVGREGEAVTMSFRAPPEVMRYVVAKGFIAVEGVSLTVVDCNDRSFSVSLVAETQARTTLAHKRPGDTVNLEADVLGKYVERFVRGQTAPITEQFLAQHGYR